MALGQHGPDRVLRVEGNRIGTDAAGAKPLPNGTGVYISGASNTVGGTAGGAGNTISGNGSFGVWISGGSGNLVQGNRIGTDTAGATALANGTGVLIDGSNNTVGGTAAAAGNLISANTNYGIRILTGSGNVLQGNRIGTDSMGTTKLPNDYGVVITSSNNTVGGTVAGAGNLVSGNATDGVQIASGGGNLIQGNRIGTDVTGTTALANGRAGVYIFSSNNTVGGTVAGAANTIAFNASDGVLVDGGTGNAILHNAIFSSGGLGIHLTNGGNNNQPFPVLSSAASDGTTTITIQGTLTAAAITTYTLEFFANPVCNPSGFGEGKQFLGSLSVTTDASGNASFTATFAVGVPPGQFVSATATDPSGNTSQFAACITVVTGSDAPGRRPGPRLSLLLAATDRQEAQAHGLHCSSAAVNRDTLVGLEEMESFAGWPSRRAADHYFTLPIRDRVGDYRSLEWSNQGFDDSWLLCGATLPTSLNGGFPP